nr:hypothetical protein [Chryseobacterium sp.]
MNAAISPIDKYSPILLVVGMPSKKAITISKIMVKYDTKPA